MEILKSIFLNIICINDLQINLFLLFIEHDSKNYYLLMFYSVSYTNLDATGVLSHFIFKTLEADIIVSLPYS